MTNTPIKTNHSTAKKELIQVVFGAMLAALAIIVGYVEIVWPPFPFLKIDFSEVIILASLVLIGFKRTIGVIIIRSFVRGLLSPNRTDIPFPFFGETIAAIASIALIVFFLFISKLLKIRNQAEEETQQTRVKSPYDFRYDKPVMVGIKEVALIIIVTILMTVFMITINFLVVTPAHISIGSELFFTTFVESGKYTHAFGEGYLGYTLTILGMFGPFNLIKFASCLLLFSLIKKPLINEINLRS